MFDHKALGAFTLMLALTAAPVFAQEHHHPAGSPPAAATAPQAMPGMGQGTQGGMGQGMQNMPMMGMREGGTQQQGMSCCGMCGGGAQGRPAAGMMCGMMRQGGMGSMSTGGMPVMADRTEGRLAFLKTELKITDAQLPLWNAVADAIRANAKSGMGMMDSMSQGSLSERLAAREKHLAAQAEALRKFKSAVDPLYAALNDEQKKTADELLMGSMGMM